MAIKIQVTLFAAHIEELIIECVDRATFTTFYKSLLARFDGTYQSEVHTYVASEFVRNIVVSYNFQM